MTARVGTKSIDGTPISGADLARIEAEEQLHVTQQKSAVRIVASVSTSAQDCRMLLSVLGLDDVAVAGARADLAAAHGSASRATPVKRARKPRAA